MYLNFKIENMTVKKDVIPQIFLSLPNLNQLCLSILGLI